MGMAYRTEINGRSELVITQQLAGIASSTKQPSVSGGTVDFCNVLIIGIIQLSDILGNVPGNISAVLDPGDIAVK